MAESLKVCSECSRELAVSSFYSIRDSKSGETRLEKFCKDCKRGRRKSSHRNSSQKREQQRAIEGIEGSCKPQGERPVGLPPTQKSIEPIASGVDQEHGFIREYRASDGDVLRLNREEYDQIVDVFRMLFVQDMRMQDSASIS
jgi:hypothetical protein